MNLAVPTDRVSSPPRQRGRSVLLRVGATLGLLVLFGSVLFAQPGVEDGTFSIQRLVLPPQRIARELAKVQNGTLVLMPLADFDARVERAEKAFKARADKPRLTRTHYSAELVERSLTSGSGQWTIQHGGAGPALLPIDSLNLALANMRWEQGDSAELAEFDGKSLGLLVPSSERSTCMFDWSARGTLTNEGLIFNLAVPACPLTTFELKVPVDYWLSAPKAGVVVTGPHEVGSANHRLWKLQITGASELEIHLRKIAEGTGPTPTLFARVHSVQQVSHDKVLVDHDYQIDVLQGSLRDLVLQGDGALEPLDVSLKTGGVVNSWQWKVTPGKKDAKGKILPARGTLSIQFQQPVQGKIQGLRVRSQGPRPTGALWVSPDLRVNNALVRGDTVSVHLHPDLPIGVWDSGSFQLTNLVTEGDGTQILSLADTAFTAAQSHRPTLAWPSAGVEIATSETYRWHVAPRHADLSAQIQFTPVRGSTLELPIKLLGAGGYQVDSLELNPPELLRGWEPRGQYLVIELNRPLVPGKKVQVKMQLHARLPAQVGASRTLACPELQPTDGARREGTLTVTVDPSLQGQMQATTAPLAPEPVPGNGLPTWSMNFHGKKYGATLRVAPLPIRVQMRGKHLVALSEIDAGLHYHWDVEPIFGAPEYLDFRIAPGMTPGWRVKSDEGSPKFHHWERLPLAEALPHLLRLGARDGMSEALLASVLPTGAYWRFHLDEPLTKKMGFTLDATAPPGIVDQERQRLSLCLPRGDAWQVLVGALAADHLPAHGPKTWSVPLMTPLQSDHATQEIAVDSPRETIDAITVVGPMRSQPAAATRGHVLLEQYPGPGHDRSSNLLIATRPEKQTVSRAERCDDASITTCLRKDGNLWQSIAFRLWHWHDRTAQLQFPPGTTVVAIKLNDNWLERLNVQERIQGVRLTVPFDQNVESVRYEILVRSQPASLLPGLTRMNVPTVEWPAPPLDVRHRVCLENGWLPIDQDAVSAVGVPACCADNSELGRWLGRAWSYGRSWLPVGADAGRFDRLDKQKQTVLLAEAQLRLAVAGKPIKLGDAITQLTMKHLKDGAPLIVDHVALRSLGLTPTTLLPGAAMTPQARPFWESLGLVYEPCPSGALLTTPQRLRALGIDAPGHARELDPAIKEAILHGRDRSGGFLLSVAWLRIQAEPTHGFFGEATHAGGTLDPVPPTEWEVDTRNHGFYVFDPLAARVASILLIVLTTLLLMRVQRHTSAATSFRVHVLVLTAAILGLIWWPTSMREYLVLPVLGVTLVSLVVCLLRMSRGQDANQAGGGSTIVRPAAKATGLVLLFLGFTWAAAAQPAPQRAHSVYIVEGKKPMVLVLPDLISKLDAAARPPVVVARGAVLLRAKYTGRVKDATARFDVEYRIHCNKDDNLLIPLAGVQLHEGAFLDGVPVFPAAHEAGYQLPIKGQGIHHLRLSFSVRVVANGDYLDLKFTAPRLVPTVMQVDWVGGAQGLQCLHCRGEEKRSVDGRQAVTEWRAQLGAEKLVHLRWTNTATQPASKLIKVKEAHFWDLRPASESLATVLQYSVGAGTMSQLNVALPEGLYVRAVEATAQAQASAAPQPLLIKQWRVVGKAGQRRLSVDLAQPSSGTIALHLDIVPQLPLRERKLLLRLPAPLQVESVAGLLGYRLDADENPSAQNITVQSVTPEEFETLWPRKTGGAPLPTLASRAYRFQRKSQQAGLELDRRGDTRQVQYRLQWSLEARHADLAGKFTFTSSFEDLMLLELMVDPGLTLTEVLGSDVRRWHQHDALLQVWLKQPRKQTTLDVHGWHAFGAKEIAGGKRAIALPRLVPRGGEVVKADLELLPTVGIRIAEERVRPLKAPYQAAVTMSLPAQALSVESLTRIQGTPQGVELRYSFLVPTDRGRLPILKLHAKGWLGEHLRIDVPGALVRPLVLKGSRDPAWSIQYPPGLPQEVMFHVRGRLDADKQGTLGVPMLELEGTTIRHAWVAWKDIELTDAGKKLAGKNSVRDKMPTAWKADATGHSAAESARPLRAALPKSATPTSVRILSSTEAIRRAEGHWLHEATLRVYTPEAGEVRVRFPAPLVSFSALANERLLMTGKAADREVLLPLPASPQPRVLQLRWKYEATAESSRGPILAAVKIDQDLLSIPLRVLWIPRGMRSDDARPTPSLFEQLMQEADTHLHITAAMAEGPQRSDLTKKRIVLQQQQFVASTVQADYTASLIKHALPDYDVSALIDRLNDVRRDNDKQSQARGYAVPRGGSAKTQAFESGAVLNTDIDAMGTPILLPPAASSLTLQSLADRWSSEQHTRSELVLLGAVALVLFSLFRRSFALAGRFAPEIVVAGAALAMALFGLSVIGVSAIGLALFVRIAWLFAALRARLTRPTAAASVAAVPPTAEAQP